MNGLMRLLCGILSATTLFLLALFVAAEPGSTRLPLMIIISLGYVWFQRPGSLKVLPFIVPIGPILDDFLISDERVIYVTEAVLLAALSSWLFRLALGRLTLGPPPNRPALVLCGFAIVGILALIAGHMQTLTTLTGWRMVRVLILVPGVCLLLQTQIGTGQRLRALQYWTAASLVGLAVLAIGGVVEGVWGVARGSLEESGSFYGGSISLAVHLAFMGPLALAVGLSRSGRFWGWGGLVAWSAALICLPLTASRGAMGSLALTSILVTCLMFRHADAVRRRWVLTILGLAVVGLTILSAKPELAGSSFAYKYEATMAGDFFSTRVDQWSTAGTILMQSPIWGAGPDAWSPSVPLEIACRHGLPALLILLVAWAMAVRLAASSIQIQETTGSLRLSSVSLGIAVGLLGLFLVGLAETGLGARTTPLLTTTIMMAGFVALGKRS